MARGACTFKQSDITKALKAAKDAGIPVARYEIDRDGRIVVLIGKPAGVEILTPAVDDDSNEFGE